MNEASVAVVAQVDDARADAPDADDGGAGSALSALALAAREGQAGAFDQLAEQISGRLMAFARQMLFDAQLAEDAVQESMLRIYRFLPTYEGGSFLAWCLTISSRVCFDLLRRERRHRLLRFLDPPANADATEASDIRAIIEDALRELPPHPRNAFVLRQQGLSYADIAAIVGVPVGTVRSRLFEARRLLRESLTGALELGSEQ